jgi:hypothetical protein
VNNEDAELTRSEPLQRAGWTFVDHATYETGEKLGYWSVLSTFTLSSPLVALHPPSHSGVGDTGMRALTVRFPTILDAVILSGAKAFLGNPDSTSQYPSPASPSHRPSQMRDTRRARLN